MSEDLVQTTRPWLRFVLRLCRIVGWIVVGLIPLVLLIGIIGPTRIEVFILLVTGWTQFLARTVPKISFNGDLFVTSMLCGTGVLVLAHYFLKWLTGQIAASRGNTANWPWRWTWCGLSAVGILFVVGMAMGGIAHQVAWIATSPEPWYERRMDRFDLKMLLYGLQMALQDAEGDLEKTRRELKKPDNQYVHRQSNEPAPFEKYVCLLIVEKPGELAGAIFFLRSPQQQRTQSLFYWFKGEQSYFPMTKLPELLEKHQGQLLSL